jgi:hypothetical protein
MRWTENARRMGEMRNIYFESENLSGRGRLEESDIDLRITLQWITNKV